MPPSEEIPAVLQMRLPWLHFQQVQALLVLAGNRQKAKPWSKALALCTWHTHVCTSTQNEGREHYSHVLLGRKPVI